jgi:[CysO sulfur-carrier protein]-S-L-cysteine hydrolase
MPFCLRLPQDLYQAMLAQAKSEQPLECCGLLAGTIAPADPSGTTGPFGMVLGRYPLLNTARSRVLFESDPRSMLDATRDIDGRGWQILAIYHSHPSSDPIPSKTDLERNYDPAVMNLIISLQDAEPLVRAWWLTAEDYHAAEWDIVIKD